MLSESETKPELAHDRVPARRTASDPALFSCAKILPQLKRKQFDTALSFFCAYGSIIASRTLWLGDPGAILWHQLSSGSLWLFTLYMITDPKTTPTSRFGRIVFSACVAVLAAAILTERARRAG